MVAWKVILKEAMSARMMSPSHYSEPASFVRSLLCACSAALLLLLSQNARAGVLGLEEQEMADFLTGDRGQQRNRSRMTLDPILTSVARARAADMAKRRYFSHTDPDGNGPNYLARAAGYGFPSFWGKSRSENFIESIGAGYATPVAAWDGWMHSPSHRKHLLALSSFYRDQTSFGVGLYSDPASPFRRYWVIITAPPSQNVAVSSARGAKAVRIAVAMPGWSEDEDAAVSAPRPAAVKMPNAAGKLWNWNESEKSGRPRAPRPGGAG